MVIEEKLNSCPTGFEEAWVRTDAQNFFPDEATALNFQGNIAVQNLSQSLLPWKVVYLSETDLNDRLKNISEKCGKNTVDKILVQKSRLICAFVNDGMVEFYSHSSLDGCVELMSTPFIPVSVDSKSNIGWALAHRFKSVSPHEMVFRFATDSNQKINPLCVVINQCSPSFEQSISVLKFIFAKKSQCEFILIEGSDRHSMLRKHYILEDHAQVKNSWIFIQDQFNHYEEKNLTSLNERLVELNCNSNFNDKQFIVSHSYMRVSSNVKVMGKNAFAKSNCALINLGGHFDYEPINEHLESDGQSSFRLNGVYTKKSTTLFQGLVVLHKQASKSEAYQENMNLLLSNKARVDSKPRLEIHPHDVQCKHGSATSEIDESQMYYLMTRGFDKKEARKMIIKSFCQDLLIDVNYENEFNSEILSSVTEYILDEKKVLS